MGTDFMEGYGAGDYRTSPEIAYRGGVVGAGDGGATSPYRYDPYGEMRYMGLGTTAPDTASTPAGEGYNPFRPGVAYNPAGGQYPVQAIQSQAGVQFQPPGQAPEGGGGQPQRMDYEYIRGLEQKLDEGGYYGNTVRIPNFDKDTNKVVSYDVIRRDGQGNIIAVTKDVSTRTSRGRSIGYQKATKGQRNKWNRSGGSGWLGDDKARTRYLKWKHDQRDNKNAAPAPAPEDARSGYPDWVINMSNWRGI